MAVEDEWQIYFLSVLFTTDIVGAAHAPEDPHNICFSEPLSLIMKFPTRVWWPLSFGRVNVTTCIINKLLLDWETLDTCC